MTTGEETFKSRVQEFWRWFVEAASHYSETIAAGACATLTTEISAKVNAMAEGLAWEFGPGAGGGGHSLTVSGEGNLHRQLLTIYWLERAPSLPGWTFYPARQAGSIKGYRIDFGGKRFDPAELLVTAAVNPDKQNLNITVWHPLFDNTPERERWTVLFLFLDTVLGEYGTQQWIGKIIFAPQRPGDSFPLNELEPLLERVKTEHRWRNFPPGERTVGYSFEKPHTRWLRGDIVAGTTVNFPLINQYTNAEGDMKDPLAGTGADYVFVAFAASILPPGRQVEIRARIEDALDAALRSSASGRLLGGATGTVNAYIDLLLFDGGNSIEIIKRLMREKGLPAGSSINYFAKEKRMCRIAI